MPESIIQPRVADHIAAVKLEAIAENLHITQQICANLTTSRIVRRAVKGCQAGKTPRVRLSILHESDGVNDAGAARGVVSGENRMEEGRQMAEERARLAEVEVTMHAWRADHPAATLAEIEEELNRQVTAARARLLTELVDEEMASVPTTCPVCGHRLVGRGRQQRSVYTEGGELLTLMRQYATCPACGAGLFPPG
jgi:hypothetical protein